MAFSSSASNFYRFPRRRGGSVSRQAMVREGCTAAAGHGWHMLVLGPARVSTG
jgi:hypothetical protein